MGGCRDFAKRNQQEALAWFSLTRRALQGRDPVPASAAPPDRAPRGGGFVGQIRPVWGDPPDAIRSGRMR